MKIGSHVSNSGNEMLLGAVKEALSYQANCLMVYLGAPQTSYRKPIDQFKIKEAKELLRANKLSIEDVIVHAPYIINLAQPDEMKRQYAVDFIVSEIEMMDKIGTKIIVIHPGAAVGQSMEQGLSQIIRSLQEILQKTTTSKTILALETMAGKGTECCYQFEHLQTIIQAINSKRIQVCLDTCHIHDAGYDIIHAYEATINQFCSKIGVDRLAVIHINDSKNERGAKKDRHENIGFGKIGFAPLLRFVMDERFKNIAKILETPYIKGTNEKDEFPPYQYEIKMFREQVFNPHDIEKLIKEKEEC